MQLNLITAMGNSQSSQMVESALFDSIAGFKIEDFHYLDHGQKNEHLYHLRNLWIVLQV